jgi:predicted NUDIX family NTP pyrophosphohydrolase
MVVDAGEVGGANEIDRAEWVPLEEARQRLSYDRDLPVLDSFAEALPGL